MQLAASKPPAPAPCTGRQCRDELLLELQTEVREDFTITEKAPNRAFSWLKAPTSAFTFKTLLRHYAKRMLTHRRKIWTPTQKGWVGWLA